MLRLPTLLASLLLLALALAPAASAQAPGGGFASNAELVKNYAIGPSSGGKLLGGFFYITTGRALHIYDVKDAENPVQVGTTAVPDPDPGAQRAPEEDPDTNGRILLATYSGQLIVFDVSDKTAPKVLSTLADVEQHTITCVLDCTYAYGSEGDIIDLRDPKNPKLAGNWVEQVSVGSTHDVTEVAPGILLTATEPILLLDLRKDPTKPEKLAETASPGFVHATMWPHQTQDRLALVGGEALGPTCDGNKDATFQTYDTKGWQTSGTFKLLAEYTLSSGVAPVTGTMPANTFCTHWFDGNTSYRDGGLVAIGWYENGTRFLKIGLDGSIEEIGYFIPMGTRSSAVYFRNERIAYVADYYRGFDVIRFTGDLPPNAPDPGGPTSPPATPGPSTGHGDSLSPGPSKPSFSKLVKLPAARKCASAKRFRIGVRKNADPVTRLDIRVGKGKRVTVKGSKLRRPIRLKKLPKGRFSVQVQVRTRSGHTTAGSRAYRGCRS